MKPLTQRQRTILDFLTQHLKERGFAPSMREIGQEIGLNNVSAVRGHLAALEKKGYIARDADKARSIRILRSPSILSRLKKKLHQVARTDRGVIHRVVYGVALATWGGREFFTGERVRRMVERLDNRAVEHGWTIVESTIEPDHVTVTVAVWPNHSPELVARRIKSAGNSLARRYPGLCPDGLLWTGGYGVTTEPEQLDELMTMLLAKAVTDPAAPSRAAADGERP